jgi:hypothetical protein
VTPEQIDALIDAALGHLTQAGLDVTVRRERSGLTRADATVALRWAGSRQRWAVHATDAIRLRDLLEARAAGPVLVVAPWIAPSMGERLRAAQVAYVDSVGNAAVRFGPVLIEVSGRKRPGRGLDTSSPTTGGRVASASERIETRSGQLLTPANRQVISALLADPSLETATLRELAAAAGVSVGQAHKSVALLASAGYHRGHLDEAQRAALSGVLDAVRDFEA